MKLPRNQKHYYNFKSFKHFIYLILKLFDLMISNFFIKILIWLTGKDKVMI